MTKPKFSFFWFILLFLLGGIPALIYLFIYILRYFKYRSQKAESVIEENDSEAYLKSLVPIPYDIYKGLKKDLKPYAFWIRDINDLKALSFIKSKLDAHFSSKYPYREKREICECLSAFWGKDLAKQRTNEIINYFQFRAYRVGEYQRALEMKEIMPYFKYLGSSTSEPKSHSALNGLILPVDDPFWNNHMPPTWDWMCKGMLISLSQRQFEIVKRKQKSIPWRERRILNWYQKLKLRKGFIYYQGEYVDIRPPADAPLCIKDVRMPTGKIIKKLLKIQNKCR